jgi:ketosteroid isomerase-like protein
VTEPTEPARLVNAQRFFMGITTDKPHDVLPLLSPDVVYAVPGHSPMAGIYRGPAEVLEHMDKLFSITSHTFEVLKWVDWLVGLTHVAAVQFAQAQGSGSVYRSHHVYLVETDQHDLITKVQIFFEDQARADTFFSNLPTT